jgi:outer membrane protein OmpA-like peptidoglycan-associated protein
MFRYPITILFSFILVHYYGQETEVVLHKSSSSYNDYAPTPYRGDIVFCSDRPSKFGIKWVDAQGNYPSKLYFHQENRSVILDEKLVTRYNEGPACFNETQTEIIYTGTLPTGKGSEQNKLGLFTSTWSVTGWSEAQTLSLNSNDNSYSIAHPFLSPDGQTLYFTSDMPNGYGGMDIYFSLKNGTSWSEPKNLGATINSDKDEIFPFISKNNTFTFSSNRNGQFDIYQSIILGEKFAPPAALAPPINSDKDDFSYVMLPDNESGYFASNRNGKGDDIFKFTTKYPEFVNCPPIELPSFCYLFEETNIVPNDSTPMIFEWELGDGQLGSSLSVEHCYKEYGNYHVALNVYDSLTHVRFARVSEVDVQIARSPYPYITSSDTLGQNEMATFSAEGTDLENTQIEKYFWTFNDGFRGQGYSVKRSFASPGIYTAQLGLITKTETGELNQTCATKTFAVGNTQQIEAYMAEVSSENKPSNLQENMLIVHKDTADYLLHHPDSTVYFVEFKLSEEKLAQDDPYFNNIKYEITERYDSAETAYRYSVGHTNEVQVMLRVYRDMMSNGYIESIVREEIQHDFKQEIIKTWWYLPDSMRTAINEHINKFNDIRFDQGTYHIREESFDNLNYIAEVMNLEQSVRLMIKAHTDSVGSYKDNLLLAQKRADAVITYLTKQGVSKTRLVPKGYGEARPLADNKSAEGRALNRRVEFEILFETKKQPNQ